MYKKFNKCFLIFLLSFLIVSCGHKGTSNEPSKELKKLMAAEIAERIDDFDSSGFDKAFSNKKNVNSLQIKNKVSDSEDFGTHTTYGYHSKTTIGSDSQYYDEINPLTKFNQNINSSLEKVRSVTERTESNAELLPDYYVTHTSEHGDSKYQYSTFYGTTADNELTFVDTYFGNEYNPHDEKDGCGCKIVTTETYSIIGKTENGDTLKDINYSNYEYHHSDTNIRNLTVSSFENGVRYERYSIYRDYNPNISNSDDSFQYSYSSIYKNIDENWCSFSYNIAYSNHYNIEFEINYRYIEQKGNNFVYYQGSDNLYDISNQETILNEIDEGDLELVFSIKDRDTYQSVMSQFIHELYSERNNYTEKLPSAIDYNDYLTIYNGMKKAKVTAVGKVSSFGGYETSNPEIALVEAKSIKGFTKTAEHATFWPINSLDVLPGNIVIITSTNHTDKRSDISNVTVNGNPINEVDGYYYFLVEEAIDYSVYVTYSLVDTRVNLVFVNGNHDGIVEYRFYASPVSSKSQFDPNMYEIGEYDDWLHDLGMYPSFLTNYYYFLKVSVRENHSINSITVRGTNIVFEKHPEYDDMYYHYFDIPGYFEVYADVEYSGGNGYAMVKTRNIDSRINAVNLGYSNMIGGGLPIPLDNSLVDVGQYVYIGFSTFMTENIEVVVYANNELAYSLKEELDYEEYIGYKSNGYLYYFEVIEDVTYYIDILFKTDRVTVEYGGGNEVIIHRRDTLHGADLPFTNYAYIGEYIIVEIVDGSAFDFEPFGTFKGFKIGDTILSFDDEEGVWYIKVSKFPDNYMFIEANVEANQ